MGWIDVFDISLDRANQFYTWGWRLSAFGAAITMIGVAALWLGTRARDHDFEEQMAGLHERAATSEKLSKELEKGNLTLQTELERERLERLRIEKQLKPRTITLEERSALLNCLAPLTKGPVTVIPKTFDVEAEQYANQISEVLKDANFEIKAHTGPRPFGFGMAGVFAVFNDATHPPPHAGEIQHCLRQIGVELGGGANPDWVKDPNLVVIAVSQKP
jgi:hypothetical protein